MRQALPRPEPLLQRTKEAAREMPRLAACLTASGKAVSSERSVLLSARRSRRSR